MAGRRRKRARQLAQRRWFGRSFDAGPVTDLPAARLIEELGGCDTRHYDVAVHIQTGGLPVSEWHVRQHQLSMPRLIASGNEHTTRAGPYEIVTRCRRGRLDTTVF